MHRVYSYTLTIPLRYCTYSLFSEDSELVMGLQEAIEWEEPQSIREPYPLDENQIFTAESKIHFCISGKYIEEVSNTGQPSIFMPDKVFYCTISGVVAENKSKAMECVDEAVLRACKALSVLISCGNCNKHGYQPRVEPDYKGIMWQKEPFEPYARLVEEILRPSEMVDEQGNRIIQMYADYGDIEAGDLAHTMIHGPIDSSRFLELYHYDKSPQLTFLLDEYYAALGSEALSSKFFHLFSMIEFIEKNYVDFAHATPIFDETDKTMVKKALRELKMPKEKRGRLIDTVCNAISKPTQFNREEKLVLILHQMGIWEFTNCGTEFIIDELTVKELIKLRNSYFHGDSKGSEHSEEQISVKLAVARLMYICEKIILYALDEK